jgi:hypothetical protein
LSELQVDIHSSIRGFRTFVETEGKVISEVLTPLLSAVGTIPVSTVECERVFSQMNLIVRPAFEFMEVIEEFF